MLYLCIWTSINTSIGYFFSRCVSGEHAQTPHTYPPFTHDEIVAAWMSLDRSDSDFTRLEAVHSLNLRQKYHVTQDVKRLQFARWLVEHGRLNENEVTG